MTAQELQTRLKSHFEALRETSVLISRLSKLSIQSGRNSPQISEETESRVELSAEIHQSLKEQEEEYELIRQEVEDFTSSGTWGSGARRRDSEKDRDRITLVTQVERLDEDLKLARTQFRKAQLQAKRNEEAAKRKEREQLFAGVQEGRESPAPGRRKGQEKFSQDDLLVNASSDVTAALRRTHQLMQSELARSQFANDTLKQSTAALQSLNENYSVLDNLLSSSRSLVSTLISSQKSDTWYLESAFKVLVYTIIWLIFRRWFLGPARFILYPVKWMFSLVTLFLNITLSTFAALVGAGGKSSTASALSGTATQLSSSRTLIVQPSAKGRPPKFSSNMQAPSIAVGAGGEGAKAKKTEQGEGSIVDKVNQIIGNNGLPADELGQADGGQGEGQGDTLQGGDNGDQTVLRDRRVNEPPNPKKRMFEELPPQEQGGQVRDEL